MSNDVRQVILNRIEKIDSDIDSIKTDISGLKVAQDKIEPNLSWIKIFLSIVFAMIIFLLGVSIRVLMVMP